MSVYVTAPKEIINAVTHTVNHRFRNNLTKSCRFKIRVLFAV